MVPKKTAGVEIYFGPKGIIILSSKNHRIDGVELPQSCENFDAMIFSERARACFAFSEGFFRSRTATLSFEAPSSFFLLFCKKRESARVGRK